MDDTRILIIEDEKPIADILAYGFKKQGFVVTCAHTGGAGIEAAEQILPHIVLLDWMLPDISGVDVCKMLTERFNVPIIMLTARNTIEDKLYGLESGADDYITKPFELREVVARVHTILRRYAKAQGIAGKETEEICPEGLVLSEKERLVYLDGAALELTPKEYDLLAFFMKHPRQVFTRAVLLERIWGYDFAGDSRTVDIHVQRLRKKADLGTCLITVFGVGYKYVPE